MKKYMAIILMLILGGAGFVQADDTEIYGTVTSVSLKPNVLIIFDSSGSMDTEDVPGDPYDPVTTYTGSSVRDAVYILKSGSWSVFASDVNDLNCTDIKNELLSQGYARGRIRGARRSYVCGGRNKRLRLGNYMNYIESGVGQTRRRIDVAKDVITDLINMTDDVRFGAMRFNHDQGGRLIAECEDDNKTSIISQIDAINADGWTPLAETLAEAGLYFAGKDSWYNSGVSYTSPMEERCQKNYIIIMTDGQPTQDRDWRLTSGAYINGDTIGDYDNDGHDPGSYDNDGSDYLDDVAAYLYEEDTNPGLGDGTSFDKQNIITFTIGFQSSQQLLEDTAANGGGEYYTATNYSDLSEAFYQIMSSISEENAVFVAPVVPISRMNRTYARDRIYLGFFKPQLSGRWIGNIKRYGLGDDGTLYDANGMVATTDDGLIKDNALSYWTSLGNDGPDVEAGGAAEVLGLLIDSTGSRNLYTYTGTEALLTDASNAFVDANTSLTNAALDVADDTQRQDLITGIHEGEFGDIVHSEPMVVYYADPDGDPATTDAKNIIFTGSNDGLLHCVDDDDGSEAWGFVPPDQLDRLKLLDNNDHEYFMDGSPVVYYQQSSDGPIPNILIMGERRGGFHYNALDITTYNAPRWLYTIEDTILDPDPSDSTDTYEKLGQSWGKPEVTTIATDATVTINPAPACDLSISTSAQDAFMIPGGYDNNQDQQTPNAQDSFGRALLAINVSTGQLISNFHFSAVTHPSLGMTHSIVDLSALDHDGDGIVSRVYAGDLGGNVFAFKDDELQNYTVCSETVSQVIVDGSWTATKLFSASAADGVQRKIFYAPDAVAESFGEYIFFGTGDRADPGETGVVNRIYAVKNDWSASATLDETGLVDVTDDWIQLGTEIQKQAVRTDLEINKGWYIRLENPGEKVVSSPRVYAGVVYVTTYTPSSDTPTDGDPCAVSTVRGVARLYALDYKTGASMHEFSSEVETDAGGNAVALGKKDRSVAIGTAIPSAPVIAVLSGGARIFVGVEGGIASLPTIANQDMYRYYWTQIF